MKVAIFNSNDSKANQLFDRKIDQVYDELSIRHDVTILKLSELNINYCNGCWGCWVKEPGRCVIKDDMEYVQKLAINSDLIVFASPMKMGFANAMAKKVTDRLIPLVHPYIELVEEECHHVKRYDKYPFWGLILQEENSDSIDDIELVSDIYRRTALNLKSSLLFATSINKPIKEIANEINHL